MPKHCRQSSPASDAIRLERLHPHPLKHPTSVTRVERQYDSIRVIEPLPYFDADTIFEAVSMTDAVEALRRAFASRPTHVARAHLRTAGAEFLVMPAANGDAAGAKMVIIQPKNELSGRPVIQGLYVLFDAAGGRPLALLDGAALTLLRTPAVSALATDVLARPDVTSVGILGTGPQALAHPAAMRAVRPSVHTVIVAGRSSERVDAVVNSLNADGFEARSGTWAEAAACDLVCGCTRSSEPLFSVDALRPGAHLNLVGSYRTDLREVGADVISHATIFVDEIEAARAEAGELTMAVAEGRWTWNAVAGDLSDLAAGNAGRTTTGEITLFKSVGLAVQDLAIAQQVARSRGLL
jgi:ornithine cyclodeaminase/alanine dehydrogenase-like protein (mu-crystallin family)